MKTFYIESIDTWVVAVGINGFLDNEEKEAIRNAFKKQGIFSNVLVLDGDFEFVKQGD
ncbi:hypothetical protein [Ligilactobacillus acidipiscis]|uniref:hypothetical protein n=1 Tax=Ligilactobacillus acidipiscis TaxID=89059 RepID=UPI0023F8EF02|nr:hypothetical protein [Ligilactobacillus acidipiscis]WEV57853.1 hypothetical protein OZX66_04760 [Ligilactobacillus acidipiscis]